MQCPRTLEKGVRSPGSGVTDVVSSFADARK